MCLPELHVFTAFVLNTYWIPWQKQPTMPKHQPTDQTTNTMSCPTWLSLRRCPTLKCSCCYVINSCLASAFSGVQMQHWMQNLIFNGFTLDLLRQWRRFHAVAVMQLLFMPSFIFVHGEHAQWVHFLPFKFQQKLFRARWNWNTFKKYFVFSSTAPENCHCVQVKTHQYHIYEQNYWWIGGH